ncbi:hypothetical protein AMTRI_Chr13g118420 [Amborella trichopoda]
MVSSSISSTVSYPVKLCQNCTQPSLTYTSSSVKNPVMKYYNCTSCVASNGFCDDYVSSVHNYNTPIALASSSNSETMAKMIEDQQRTTALEKSEKRAIVKILVLCLLLLVMSIIFNIVLVHLLIKKE